MMHEKSSEIEKTWQRFGLQATTLCAVLCLTVVVSAQPLLAEAQGARIPGWLVKMERDLILLEQHTGESVTLEDFDRRQSLVEQYSKGETFEGYGWQCPRTPQWAVYESPQGLPSWLDEADETLTFFSSEEKPPVPDPAAPGAVEADLQPWHARVEEIRSDLPKNWQSCLEEIAPYDTRPLARMSAIDMTSKLKLCVDSLKAHADVFTRESAILWESDSRLRFEMEVAQDKNPGIFGIVNTWNTMIGRLAQREVDGKMINPTSQSVAEAHRELEQGLAAALSVLGEKGVGHCAQETAPASGLKQALLEPLKNLQKLLRLQEVAIGRADWLIEEFGTKAEHFRTVYGSAPPEKILRAAWNPLVLVLLKAAVFYQILDESPTAMSWAGNAFAYGVEKNFSNTLIDEIKNGHVVSRLMEAVEAWDSRAAAKKLSLRQGDIKADKDGTRQEALPDPFNTARKSDNRLRKQFATDLAVLAKDARSLGNGLLEQYRIECLGTDGPCINQIANLDDGLLQEWAGALKEKAKTPPNPGVLVNSKVFAHSVVVEGPITIGGELKNLLIVAYEIRFAADLQIEVCADCHLFILTHHLYGDKSAVPFILNGEQSKVSIFSSSRNKTPDFVSLIGKGKFAFHAPERNDSDAWVDLVRGKDENGALIREHWLKVSEILLLNGVDNAQDEVRERRAVLLGLKKLPRPFFEGLDPKNEKVDQRLKTLQQELFSESVEMLADPRSEIDLPVLIVPETSAGKGYTVAQTDEPKVYRLLDKVTIVDVVPERIGSLEPGAAGQNPRLKFKVKVHATDYAQERLPSLVRNKLGLALTEPLPREYETRINAVDSIFDGYELESLGQPSVTADGVESELELRISELGLLHRDLTRRKPSGLALLAIDVIEKARTLGRYYLPISWSRLASFQRRVYLNEARQLEHGKEDSLDIISFCRDKRIRDLWVHNITGLGLYGQMSAYQSPVRMRCPSKQVIQGMGSDQWRKALYDVQGRFPLDKVFGGVVSYSGSASVNLLEVAGLRDVNYPDKLVDLEDERVERPQWMIGSRGAYIDLKKSKMNIKTGGYEEEIVLSELVEDRSLSFLVDQGEKLEVSFLVFPHLPQKEAARQKGEGTEGLTVVLPAIEPGQASKIDEEQIEAALNEVFQRHSVTREGKQDVGDA